MQLYGAFSARDRGGRNGRKMLQLRTVGDEPMIIAVTKLVNEAAESFFFFLRNSVSIDTRIWNVFYIVVHCSNIDIRIVETVDVMFSFS
jgi:hypothetical protein